MVLTVPLSLVAVRCQKFQMISPVQSLIKDQSIAILVEAQQALHSSRLKCYANRDRGISLTFMDQTNFGGLGFFCCFWTTVVHMRAEWAVAPRCVFGLDYNIYDCKIHKKMPGPVLYSCKQHWLGIYFIVFAAFWVEGQVSLVFFSLLIIPQYSTLFVQRFQLNFRQSH